MKKIYVIRHGKTELNKKDLINGHLDDPLIEEGQIDAEKARTTLPLSISHIYVSNLTRTKETAEIINKDRSLPLSFHDELKEVNFGILNGTPFLDEYKKIHASMKFDWGPTGENDEQFRSRVIGFLHTIAPLHSSGEILLVAHGGVIRLLHLLQYGKILNEQPKNAEYVEFDLDEILK